MPAGGTEVAVDTGVETDHEETSKVELPEILPVLPLKNTVLFPYLLNPLLVNSERSKRLIDAVLLTPQRLMLSCAVRHEVEGSPGPDDVYRTGTVLRIVKMLKFPDGSYRLLVQGVVRAHIEEFVSVDPFLSGRIQRLHETGDLDSVEVTALVRNARDQFSTVVAESMRLSDDLQVLAANIEEPSRLADLVASNLDVDVATKQGFLEEVDLAARLKRVVAELTRSQQAMKIETEIREKVQSEMGKTQREYMLRQQLEAIRRELGESEDADAEVDQLREQIEAAAMPEEARKQADHPKWWPKAARYWTPWLPKKRG